MKYSTRWGKLSWRVVVWRSFRFYARANVEKVKWASWLRKVKMLHFFLSINFSFAVWTQLIIKFLGLSFSVTVILLYILQLHHSGQVTWWETCLCSLNKEKNNGLILFLCQSRVSKTCFVSNGKHPNWDICSEQTILWFHARSQKISNTSNQKKRKKKWRSNSCCFATAWAACACACMHA